MVKQFVVDYNTETFEPLMEHEVNGLDYKYVYGNDRLSVDISPITTSSGNIIENGDHIRLYYHMDYLGTTDYLTSPVSLKVTAWTHYNEWGLIVHNAVLKCGQRQLDLVKRYATHDYDSVLELYYAKARFYDAANRRFTAMDPILNPSEYDISAYVTDPMKLVQYLYVVDNPLSYVDPTGEIFIEAAAVFLFIGVAATVTVAYSAWISWVNSPAGQKTIDNATKVIYNGVTYVKDQIAGFVDSVTAASMLSSPEAFAKAVSVPDISDDLQKSFEKYSMVTSASMDEIIAKYDLLKEYKAQALETVRVNALNIDDIEKNEYYNKIRCEAIATIKADGKEHKGIWSVYVLTESKNKLNVIYVGMTTEPKRRETEHRRTKTDYPNLALYVVETGISDRNTARVTEMAYMTAFFPEIYAAKQNKIRSVSVKKMNTVQMTQILASIAGDLFENEVLSLMDEVHFRY